MKREGERRSPCRAALSIENLSGDPGIPTIVLEFKLIAQIFSMKPSGNPNSANCSMMYFKIHEHRCILTSC
uniref:Uncharacterized protein n=1 Tax=Lepeophtheirus salmonis TaxID=72036 RepID=A0A0K2URY1_LEPSM